MTQDSKCLFDCDSCGKISSSGVAKMIIDNVVFVVCWNCAPLLPDIIDEYRGGFFFD